MTPVAAIGPGAEVASVTAPVVPGFEALFDAATIVDIREIDPNGHPGLAPGPSCFSAEATGSRDEPGMTMVVLGETDAKEASAEVTSPADAASPGWLDRLIGLFGGAATGIVVPDANAKPPSSRRLDDPNAPAAGDPEDVSLDLTAVPSAPIAPASFQVAHLLPRHPGESRDPIGVEWAPASAGMTDATNSSHFGGPVSETLGDAPARSADLAGPAPTNAKRGTLGEANSGASAPAMNGEPAAAPLWPKDAALPVQSPFRSDTAGPALKASASQLTGSTRADTSSKAAQANAVSFNVAAASAAPPSQDVRPLQPIPASATAGTAQSFLTSVSRATLRQPRDPLSDLPPSAAAVAPRVLPTMPVDRTTPMPAPVIDALPTVDATVRSQGNSFDLATQSLGALHVALETSDAAMRVHVVAERSATASLIVGQGDRLQAVVETSGHRLGALSVEIRDGDAGRRPLHWQAAEPATPRRAATPAAVAARTPDRFA